MLPLALLTAGAGLALSPMALTPDETYQVCGVRQTSAAGAVLVNAEGDPIVPRSDLRRAEEAMSSKARDGSVYCLTYVRVDGRPTVVGMSTMPSYNSTG